MTNLVTSYKRIVIVMHRELRMVNSKLVQATYVHKVSYRQYWATLKGHSSLGYHIGELFFVMKH